MVLLKDFILVKEPLEEEKKTAGGIIVSTDNKTSPSDPISNEVVNVGRGVSDVCKGDRVVYLPREGLLIKREDCNYRLLREENIIAVLSDEEDF